MADEAPTQDQILARLTGQQPPAAAPAVPPAAPPATPPAAPAAPAGETPTDPADNDAAKWKALSRQNEARAKENADKAKLWDEYQKSQQTAAEQAAAALAEAQKTASEAQAQLLRYEVANTKGVPANLLVGSTKEELEASADALIAFRGQQPTNPAPNLGQGNRGTAPQESPNDWIRRAAGIRF